MNSKIDYKQKYISLKEEYHIVYEENIMLRDKDYKDISNALDYDIKENVLRSFELDIKIGIDTCCDMDGTMCIKRPMIDQYIQNYIKNNYIIEL